MAEQKVPYQVDGRPFEGMIVYDGTVAAKRPAIFMQPDWKGVCADTIAQASTGCWSPSMAGATRRAIPSSRRPPAPPTGGCASCSPRR